MHSKGGAHGSGTGIASHPLLTVQVYLLQEIALSLSEHRPERPQRWRSEDALQTWGCPRCKGSQEGAQSAQIQEDVGGIQCLGGRAQGWAFSYKLSKLS